MHDYFARLCKIVLTLLYTRLDRMEITWSRNDLEATGVIAGSVAGENISRDDDGRLRQKVAQSIDFFELYQLVSFPHNHHLKNEHDEYLNPHGGGGGRGGCITLECCRVCENTHSLRIV